jgi:peptide/nickel transport system substrate-binding protein
VADENARLLRFEAGEIQLASPLSAESFARLQRRQAEAGGAGEGAYQLRDLGPGLTYHTLFFNLNAVDPAALPEVARKQGWFRRKGFRQAISKAIDREAIVRLVYRGKASGAASHVSPGNKLAFAAPPAALRQDLAGARQLLLAAGFRYGADGKLLDEQGAPVAFTLTTNASNRERVQMATLLQQDLAALGMAVEVVPLEFRSLIERVTGSFDYEASILGLGGGDPDPNSTLNVWQSAGASHLWQLGGKPLFPFEEKLDLLMSRQMKERDPAARQALLAEAQALIEDEQPLIVLATPHVLAAASAGLERFAPSVLDPPTLWNAEELFWRSAGP